MKKLIYLFGLLLLIGAVTMFLGCGEDEPTGAGKTPSAPTNVTVSSFGNLTITLTWTASATGNPTKYVVYVDGTKHATETTTTTWTGTLSAGNHTFEVAGVNADGEGAKSTSITAAARPEYTQTLGGLGNSAPGGLVLDGNTLASLSNAGNTTADIAFYDDQGTDKILSANHVGYWQNNQRSTKMAKVTGITSLSDPYTVTDPTSDTEIQISAGDYLVMKTQDGKYVKMKINSFTGTRGTSNYAVSITYVISVSSKL